MYVADLKRPLLSYLQAHNMIRNITGIGKGAYIVELSLFAFGQTVVQRYIANLEAGMWLRPVADQKLVLDGVIQVACFLEDLDEELEEQREPALL